MTPWKGVFFKVEEYLVEEQDVKARNTWYLVGDICENLGHLMDPWELPGLAHFCEHMLFLGTNKYPSENEYSRYISSHGGITNAFTGSDHTNYHFDIAPDHLAVSLFLLCFIVFIRPKEADREGRGGRRAGRQQRLLNCHDLVLWSRMK